MGNQVAGGVVAYQFCFVAFLAPYAILAQPIHTTILPELTVDAGDGDMARVRRPAPVGARRHVAPAAPGERGVRRARAPGDAGARGRQQPQRLPTCSPRCSRRSASACSPTARSCSSRARRTRSATAARRRSSPARARSSAPAVMVVGGLTFESDTAKVAALGLGHSAAYFVGTLVLGVVLRRRVGHGFFPHAFLPSLAASVALGGLAWLVEHLVGPSGRLADVLVLAAIGLVGLGALRAAAAHAAQARRPPRARVRTGRSRPRGRTVIRRVTAACRSRSRSSSSAPLVAQFAASGAARRRSAATAGAARAADLVAGDVVGRRADRRRPQPPAAVQPVGRRRHDHAHRRAARARSRPATPRSAPAAGRRRSRRSPAQAFETTEPYGDSTAGAVYRQRTGVDGHRRHRAPGRRGAGAARTPTGSTTRRSARSATRSTRPTCRARSSPTATARSRWSTTRCPSSSAPR